MRQLRSPILDRKPAQIDPVQFQKIEGYQDSTLPAVFAAQREEIAATILCHLAAKLLTAASGELCAHLRSRHPPPFHTICAPLKDRVSRAATVLVQNPE